MNRRRSLIADGVCLVALAAATLVLFWSLVGTNLVLAGVDAFTYFVPYRDFANAALRQGRLPLWNPYLFMGVPFLANMQAGVLYPLNWAFVGLPAAKALSWTAVLHTWLAAVFTYGFARNSIRLSRAAAWLAAAGFAFSGFLGGQVEHINQLSAGVWLPLLFWLFDLSAGGRRRRAGDTSRGIRWWAVLGLGLVVSLQLLAGHTQSAYISLVGLGTYSFWPLMDCAWCSLRARRTDRVTPAPWREVGQGGVIYLTSLALGFGLAAVQLLPTFELSQLSARAGGLSFREAVSFSLKPRMILYTLLPTYGEDLGQAFGTPAFSEFVSYIGVVGVVLALLGAWQGKPARSRRFFLVLGLAGLLLALGIYNPLVQACARVRSVTDSSALDASVRLRCYHAGWDRCRFSRSGVRQLASGASERHCPEATANDCSVWCHSIAGLSADALGSQARLAHMGGMGGDAGDSRHCLAGCGQGASVAPGTALAVCPGSAAGTDRRKPQAASRQPNGTGGDRVPA